MNHMIFVRHGESEHHARGLTGGWTDTPLTTRGRSQIADRKDSALPDRTEFTRPVLYCSDLKRAKESTTIDGEQISCAVNPLGELREFNNGDAANLTLEAASRIAFTEPATGALDWRPYRNAETWREMALRVRSALDLIEADETQTVIVVGHGNSGQALVQAWLGLALDSGVAFHFDFASVTELRVNRWGEREIVRLNAQV